MPAVLYYVISASIAVLSFVFGVGLNYFRQSRQNYAAQQILASDQVKAERTLESHARDIADLKTQQALTKQTVTNIERKLTKLDLIPQIDAKLDVVVPIVKEAVLRPEFATLVERVQAVETELHSNA